jgi:hypothetical protein
MKKFFSLLILITMFSLSFTGQTPARIVSPEVQPDRHVTFRFRAPNAVKVEVAIEGQSS